MRIKINNFLLNYLVFYVLKGWGGGREIKSPPPHSTIGVQGFFQGKGNVILTNNSKGKFPHNPLPLYLPFLPTPLQLYEEKNKIYFHSTLKGFVIFSRIDCWTGYTWVKPPSKKVMASFPKMLLLPGVLSLWDGILSSPNSESNSILSFLTLSIILYIQYDFIYKKLIIVRLSICPVKKLCIFYTIFMRECHSL